MSLLVVTHCQLVMKFVNTVKVFVNPFGVQAQIALRQIVIAVLTASANFASAFELQVNMYYSGSGLFGSTLCL